MDVHGTSAWWIGCFQATRSSGAQISDISHRFNDDDFVKPQQFTKSLLFAKERSAAAKVGEWLGND